MQEEEGTEQIELGMEEEVGMEVLAARGMQNAGSGHARWHQAGVPRRLLDEEEEVEVEEVKVEEERAVGGTRSRRNIGYARVLLKQGCPGTS